MVFMRSEDKRMRRPMPIGDGEFFLVPCMTGHFSGNDPKEAVALEIPKYLYHCDLMIVDETELSTKLLYAQFQGLSHFSHFLIDALVRAWLFLWHAYSTFRGLLKHLVAGGHR